MEIYIAASQNGTDLCDPLSNTSSAIHNNPTLSFPVLVPDDMSESEHGAQDDAVFEAWRDVLSGTVPAVESDGQLDFLSSSQWVRSGSQLVAPYSEESTVKDVPPPRRGRGRLRGRPRGRGRAHIRTAASRTGHLVTYTMPPTTHLTSKPQYPSTIADLLSLIIAHCPQLDNSLKAYAQVLLNIHPWLEDFVKVEWKKGTFRDVRRLRILRPAMPNINPRLTSTHSSDDEVELSVQTVPADSSSQNDDTCASKQDNAPESCPSQLSKLSVEVDTLTQSQRKLFVDHPFQPPHGNSAQDQNNTGLSDSDNPAINTGIDDATFDASPTQTLDTSKTQLNTSNKHTKKRAYTRRKNPAPTTRKSSLRLKLRIQIKPTSSAPAPTLKPVPSSTICFKNGDIPCTKCVESASSPDEAAALCDATPDRVCSRCNRMHVRCSAGPGRGRQKQKKVNAVGDVGVRESGTEKRMEQLVGPENVEVEGGIDETQDGEIRNTGERDALNESAELPDEVLEEVPESVAQDSSDKNYSDMDVDTIPDGDSDINLLSGTTTDPTPRSKYTRTPSPLMTLPLDDPPLPLPLDPTFDDIIRNATPTVHSSDSDDDLGILPPLNSEDMIALPELISRWNANAGRLGVPRV